MKNLVKWSICIATVPYRAKEFDRLMKVLIPQVDKYKGKIEILVFWNNFEYSLGYLRQAMLDEARGEYINHIDDDDIVPDDYCKIIFPLLDGTDYIGFKVRLIDNGKEMPPVYHSLKYTHWYQDDQGYYRGVTHLNPVRTKLARQSKFPVEFNIGEDEQWANGMAGKCKTEHFLDKVMYIYHHMGDDSVAYRFADDETAAKVHYQNYRRKPHDTPLRPIFRSKNIRFHPRSTPNG